MEAWELGVCVLILFLIFGAKHSTYIALNSKVLYAENYKMLMKEIKKKFSMNREKYNTYEFDDSNLMTQHDKDVIFSQIDP